MPEDTSKPEKLIRICATCSNILKDDSRRYLNSGVFIEALPEEKITHCICLECLKKEYPKAYKRLMERKKKETS